MKTFVCTGIPSKLGMQSLEIKGMKASVEGIAVSMNKYFEELLVNDVQLIDIKLYIF